MKRHSVYPLLAGAVLLGLAACSAPVGVDPALPAAQRDKLQREMPRPAVDAGAHFETVTVTTELPVSLAAFSGWFSQTGAPQFGTYLVGTPAVPGLLRTDALTGTWQQPGDRRRVVYIDDHTGVEEVILSQPGRLRYVGWNQTNKIGRYTSYSVADFVVTGDEHATLVQWTYSFRPKAWIDGYLIRTSVDTDYRDYMASALAAMRKAALADLAAN